MQNAVLLDSTALPLLPQSPPPTTLPHRHAHARPGACLHASPGPPRTVTHIHHNRQQRQLSSSLSLPASAVAQEPPPPPHIFNALKVKGSASGLIKHPSCLPPCPACSGAGAAAVRVPRGGGDGPHLQGAPAAPLPCAAGFEHQVLNLEPLVMIRSLNSPLAHLLAPSMQVGGLGDVVTSLGRAVQENGHQVEVILPRQAPFFFLSINAKRGVQENGHPVEVILPRQAASLTLHTTFPVLVDCFFLSLLQSVQCRRVAARWG